MAGTRSSDGEAESGRRMKDGTGPENHRRERRLVRRIGKVLCLETKAVALPINMAVLAGERAVEKISGVELHAGLGGQNLEHAAGVRLPNAGRGYHAMRRALGR